MKSEAIDTADENRTSPVEGVDTASLPPAQQLKHFPVPQQSRMAQPGLMAYGLSR